MIWSQDDPGYVYCGVVLPRSAAAVHGSISVSLFSLSHILINTSVKLAPATSHPLIIILQYSLKHSFFCSRLFV